MSTNKTTNYGFHQWDRSDDFIIEEINENAALVDAALMAKGKWVVGTYVGDGTNDREFDLGGPILAVLVENILGFRASTSTSRNYGGLCLPGFSLRNDCLRVEGHSFFVSSEPKTAASSNSTNCLGDTMFYLALVQLP